MKTLITTLFFLGFVELLVQDIRHIQVYIFRDEKPALYEFRKDIKEVQKAGQTDDVDALKAQLKVKNDEVDNIEKGKTKDELSALKETEHVYKEQSVLEREITDRVEKSREIRNLWIFCGVGFGLICIGMIMFKRCACWVSLGMITTGFVELIYWSSPSFFYGGAYGEYSLLLMNKIVITTFGIAFLLASFLWYRKSVS